MADGRANNGKGPNNKTLWRKGHVANPHGSSERVRKLAQIKRLTIDELAEVGSIILRNNRSELSDLQEDPETSILQFWIMALVTKSVQRGDVQTFDTLMTRLIGKPPEQPVSRMVLELERTMAETGVSGNPE